MDAASTDRGRWPVTLVVAAGDNGVIGVDGGLPWHLPDDLRHFKRVTMGRPVIMGRRTWDERGTPLPGRTNIVLTRDPGWSGTGALRVGSLEEALEAADGHGGRDRAAVIGGGVVYRLAMAIAGAAWVTRVHASPDGDATFPELDPRCWTRVEAREHARDERHAHAFTIERWVRVDADGA